MPWWAWLLVSIIGVYVLLVVLLLGATFVIVQYFKWRKGEKPSAVTERE